ncbi:PACE efflux transporter [Pseudochrobactrum sp. HB0163]|uniref:PACE efflux transporter n=1 Tax=Pseudochrobactrum sp. HB0163 TaxID=3450708 RepID=UPI003F6DF12A
MFVLSPTKRRILYVSVFEIIAIIASTFLLMLLSGGSAENSLPIAVLISLIAVTWNYTYNFLFEKWEARRKAAERSLIVRMCHAFGFEFGLCVMIIPLYMVWYAVGFWKAFEMEAVLLLFFLIYTFVFTYIFDMIFALPNSVVGKEKVLQA